MKLHFDNVSVTFGEHIALRPLTLTLSEQRIGILGLNGSGKSTFTRLIANLITPTFGTVSINGCDTQKDAKRLHQTVGYIFQNPANQIIMPVVLEDMEFGLLRSKLSKTERTKICTETLSQLGIEYLSNRRAHVLSGGELQLAALASVLAVGPDLIIFDEPTNQLDLRNRRKVETVIQELDQQTIVITHDLSLVETYDRVLVFHEGYIVADTCPSQAAYGSYWVLSLRQAWAVSFCFMQQA